jgi:hypothetical protein
VDFRLDGACFGPGLRTRLMSTCRRQVEVSGKYMMDTRTRRYVDHKTK